jgi:hypothetical protein
VPAEDSVATAANASDLFVLGTGVCSFTERLNLVRLWWLRLTVPMTATRAIKRRPIDFGDADRRGRSRGLCWIGGFARLFFARARHHFHAANSQAAHDKARQQAEKNGRDAECDESTPIERCAGDKGDNGCDQEQPSITEVAPDGVGEIGRERVRCFGRFGCRHVGLHE